MGEQEGLWQQTGTQVIGREVEWSYLRHTPSSALPQSPLASAEQRAAATLPVTCCCHLLHFCCHSLSYILMPQPLLPQPHSLPITCVPVCCHRPSCSPMFHPPSPLPQSLVLRYSLSLPGLLRCIPPSLLPQSYAFQLLNKEADIRSSAATSPLAHSCSSPLPRCRSRTRSNC